MRRRFYFVTPMREIGTIGLCTHNLFEPIDFGSRRPDTVGRMYSKTESAYMIIDDNGEPERFLDISALDTIIDIHRGRWLIVKSNVDSMTVHGTNVTVSANMYMYDIITSKVVKIDVVPEGDYICSTTEATEITSGLVIKSSFLISHEILDICPVTATAASSTNDTYVSKTPGTPVMSNSPMATGSMTTGSTPKFIYILKPRNKTRDYLILIGPQWTKNAKLNTIKSFTGTYWHVHWPWIAYNNVIDNLYEPKKGHVIEQTIQNNGLTLTLSDIYFVTNNTAILIYSSNNFQAVLIKTLS